MDLHGEWQGNYSLWFGPGDPQSESATDAIGEEVVLGAVMMLRYRWVYEDEEQTGLYLLSADGDATLSDTFHTGGGLMACNATEDGSFIGSFEAEDATWGWRTKVELADGSLTITAWNVSPDGEEVLATRAVYTQ